MSTVLWVTGYDRFKKGSTSNYAEWILFHNQVNKIKIVTKPQSNGVSCFAFLISGFVVVIVFFFISLWLSSFSSPIIIFHISLWRQQCPFETSLPRLQMNSAESTIRQVFQAWHYRCCTLLPLSHPSVFKRVECLVGLEKSKLSYVIMIL